MWSVWNSVRCTSPLQTSEVVVLQFLNYLHYLNKSYSVINSYKAMLMVTLPFFGNSWVKDCPLIVRFMKGIYFSRKPKPRYLFTWDVTCVFKYLKTLVPLQQLPIKLLTLKVTALIALAVAPRAQTLVSMDLDCMVRENNALVFCFPHVLKTSRAGHSYSLKVEHYSDESLCAMHTLLHYIDRTKEHRLSSKIFISYITYKAVTTSTIARWLKKVLELSGIDTEIFKAHSFRGASASAALSGGCSVQSILKTADWSSEKNFKKFYCRHAVKSSQTSYVKAVFGGQK